MKTVQTFLIPVLYIPPTLALTSPCPSGQNFLDNKKCCPGPLVGASDGSGGDYCCVLPGSAGSTPPLSNPNCVARISVDDPDYDAKLSAAMQSASATGTGTATATSTAAVNLGHTGAAVQLGGNVMVAELLGLFAAVFGGM